MARTATRRRRRRADFGSWLEKCSVSTASGGADAADGKYALLSALACVARPMSRSTVADRHNFAQNMLAGRRHRRGDPGCGAIGDSADRVIGEMRVDFGGSGLFVPQHLADQVETVAVGHGERREAVPQIVDAHALEPRACPHPLPILLQSDVVA